MHTTADIAPPLSCQEALPLCRAPSLCQVEVVVTVSSWHQLLPQCQQICTQAATATLNHLKTHGAPLNATLNAQGHSLVICLADQQLLHELNQRFRGRNHSTNVLAFPTKDDPPLAPALGDIAVSYTHLTTQADKENQPHEALLAHWIVHATLHLCGFDHQNEQQAQAMELSETQILANLGWPNPYEHSPTMDEHNDRPRTS